MPAQQLLCVVVHDVAPATRPACERLLRCIEQIAALPVTLLVTPRWHLDAHDASFERWAGTRLGRADEIALHGYTHQDDGQPRDWLDHARRRWYTRGEGEFAALSEGEAASRLAAGMRWFKERGWPLHGFVAPAWLMSEGTWHALDKLPFAYTATLASVIALPEQRRLRSQAIVYSTQTAWRRMLSLGWNAALARSQRHAALLRLELHPSDVGHSRIRSAWMRLLARALQDRTAVTVHRAVELLARSPQPGAVQAADSPQGQTASATLAVAAPTAAPASTSLG